MALELNKEYPNIIATAFVGNKIDLFDRRNVSTNEGEIFAKNNGFLFFETSTLKQINIKECFNELINYININIRNFYTNLIKYKNY